MKQKNNRQIAVGFVALGCPKNVVDSEKMLAQIVEDTDIAQRKALVTAMRKHFSKQSKG